MSLTEGEQVHLKSGRFRIEVNNELRNRVDDLLGKGHYKLLMSRPSR